MYFSDPDSPLFNSERLLRRPEVERRTGKSRSEIYRLMKDGSFPKSVPIGARAVGWPESQISEWIQSKIQEAQPA